MILTMTTQEEKILVSLNRFVPIRLFKPCNGHNNIKKKSFENKMLRQDKEGNHEKRERNKRGEKVNVKKLTEPLKSLEKFVNLAQ